MKQPKVITLATLEVILTPNGEVICLFGEDNRMVQGIEAISQREATIKKQK